MDATRLQVPLISEKLGVEQVDDALVKRMSSEIARRNGRVQQLIAVILAAHFDMNDVRPERMIVSVSRVDGQAVLNLENISESGRVGTQLEAWQRGFVSEILRDVVLAPELPSSDSGPAQISAFVREMVSRSGLLDVSTPRLRTSVQGGHSIPPEEKIFARKIGYMDGFLGTELITGSGPGVMREPFVGASTAYRERGLSDHRSFIGFSEEGIAAFEIPNSYVTNLVVFPDIEKRMEAFVRASHRIRIHPGGVGTMEEIMTMLGIKTHPMNRNLHYPLDLVERPDGFYMKSLMRFLRTCFGKELDSYFKVHLSHPHEYKNYLLETNPQLDSSCMWQDHIHIPSEIQRPFEVTRESIESLTLDRTDPDLDTFGLIVNLRRFFSAVVHLLVKEPELVDSWGGDLPHIKGDPAISRALVDLLNEFNDRQRLKLGKEIREIPVVIG